MFAPAFRALIQRLSAALVLLALACVLGGCALLAPEAGEDAQSPLSTSAAPTSDDASEDAHDDEDEPATAPADESSSAGFDLHIHAPRKIRNLLMQHMELQSYRALSDLRASELARLVAAAPANISELLATRGYFQPHIAVQIHYPEGDPRTSATAPQSSSAATRPQVIITIEAGSQARVQTVELDFQGSITHTPEGQQQMQAVRRGWGAEPGSAFTQSAWQQAKSDAVAKLHAQRYPTAQIALSDALVVLPPDAAEPLEKPSNDPSGVSASDPVATSASAPASARLSVNIDSGPLYKFGPLVIEGAQRYNPAGAVRLAALPVGQDYDQQILLDAQQRLARSGFYDSVFLTLDTASAPQGEDEVQVPVIAQVREAPLKKWVYGLGYSTDSGARFSLDHTHNRITDMQWRALSKIQLNRKNPLIASSIHTLPDHEGWNWFASTQLAREDLGDYTARTFNIQTGRSQSERKIDRTWSLRYDWADPRRVDRPSSSSLIASYGWTGRYFNNPYNPTNGWGFAWEAGLGTTITPERNGFARLSARWLQFIPVGGRSRDTKRQGRLAIRAHAGAVVARQHVQLPLTQLFLSGGDTTVRGYAYHSIGSRSSAGRVIGGRYMAAASVEWQRPIAIAGNRSDWEHTLFIDAGAVRDVAADVLERHNIHASVGAGIRWNSPVGPLQADLAWALKTHKPRLHLRLGFSF